MIDPAGVGSMLAARAVGAIVQEIQREVALGEKDRALLEEATVELAVLRVRRLMGEEVRREEQIVEATLLNLAAVKQSVALRVIQGALRRLATDAFA